MKTKFKQSGLTLVEQTVVIVGIVLLAVLAMPAKNALMNSFRSPAGVRSLISSAMASARAIAAKEQCYAGIRFQIRGYHEDVDSLLKAGQYIVFIIHDPADAPRLTLDPPNSTGTGLANGFRAVRGIEPIELPVSMGVMDLKVVTRFNSRPNVQYQANRIDQDIDINNQIEVRDTTTFSIIFSPDGKLVIHRVEISNRNGIRQPLNLSGSADDIFNSPYNIERNNTGMFIQDDYFSGSLPDLGLGPENSRSSFVIYERDKFEQSYRRNVPYSQYLRELEENERIYINPYTGRMINGN
ncbi:Tfp pilus assembly protein FimT/FimU [Planctomycetota bacterium]